MAARRVHPLPPGSTIGIMGGGQLGQMTSQAASRLGYKCHIFTPETDAPGSQVSAATTVADYEDRKALKSFAEACDVITFEFENVPAESAEYLAGHALVRPGAHCLAIAQDRLKEKDFVNKTAPTTAYRRVASAADLAKAADEIGRPAVLKTSRMGYDGKGQVLIAPDCDYDAAWAEMGAAEGILEAFVDLKLEISVITARAPHGGWVTYPAVENRHVNHILDTTIAPARIAPALAEEAVAIAHDIANALDLVGLLAVEMFVTRDRRVLVNELAPRPHNSGHWTMDACATSQFEQFVRAVCGLPLGSVECHHDAIMKNLIGDDVHAWPDLMADPGARLHLYGKAEARPGRKMGHVNRLYAKGDLPNG
ncbi:MAG: 5-(carboxyamino)imidazole ribonucleotide synthase [Rhodospirillaceae bacterium]